MICNDLQENLMIYADDGLAPEIETLCAEHLESCPLCRAELADLQKIRGNLRKLQNTAVPENLVSSLRNAMAVEIGAVKRQPPSSFGERLKNFVLPQVMPYSIGAFASVLLFMLSFMGLYSSMNAFRAWKIADTQRVAAESPTKVYIAATTAKNVAPPPLLTAEEYSALRLDYSAESPSLNPNGSFVALTSSLTNSELNDDSIVIVADVFSDGLAKVAQVVRSSRDHRTMRELEKSLQAEPAFVPAKMDNRPDKVRVVYLIQKVNVR